MGKTESIKAIRGMNDILPEEIPIWQYLENTCRNLCAQYGYTEIRFPIVEETRLFSRTVGEVTDIVAKEMYTFEDRNGDSLSLRPEGTAGCSRACIEHGLLYNQTQRLWYLGPMFRHERPQKGRYRQFYQWGVEAYGMASPEIDAELILLSARLWKLLKLEKHIYLELNTLGSPEDRKHYHKKLVNYLKQHEDQLDEDSLNRLKTNPIRILDSKNPQMKSIIEKAPKLINDLDGKSKKHFETVCKILDDAKIKYTINPHLVRGLDYYTDTVFEWVTDALGAQGTVCAGGRYDGLVQLLGGQETPATGFAAGLERLVLLLKADRIFENKPDVFVVAVGEEAIKHAMLTTEKLRNTLPSLKIQINLTNTKFKSQFKQADKSGARFALIFGEDEIKMNKISIKELRGEGSQKQFSLDELIKFCDKYFNEGIKL